MLNWWFVCLCPPPALKISELVKLVGDHAINITEIDRDLHGDRSAKSDETAYASVTKPTE